VVRYVLLRALAALVCLGVLSLSQTSAAPKPDQPDKPNLSGIWILDLEASTSVGPLMKQIGAGLLNSAFVCSLQSHVGGKRLFEFCFIRRHDGLIT